jgi:site-specific recombinase XerD
MNTKIYLKYNPRNRFTKDKTAPVCIEVYFSRRLRRIINPDVYIAAKQWDGKKVINHEKSAYYNSMLDGIKSNVENYKVNLLHQGKHLTPKLLDEYLVSQGSTAASGENTFNEFWKKEMYSNLSLANATLNNHKRGLVRFNQYKPAVSFSEINYDLIAGYENFLHKKNYQMNTIAKYHKFLKCYINIAVRKERLNRNPYDGFKLKEEFSKRDALSWDELRAIEKLDYRDEMDCIRDIFLFSCFSGLRFSDVINLNTSHIISNTEGLHVDLDKMIKTRRPVYLPLRLLFEGKAEKIILKYITLADLKSKKQVKIFKQLTNQHVNLLLKTIQHDAGITQLLTYHLARHTFGTNVAEISQDPYLVRDLMGHVKLETSMIYIHSSKERLVRKIQAHNWTSPVKSKID